MRYVYYNNAIKSHFADEGTEAQWDSTICRVVSAGLKARVFFHTPLLFDLGWPGEKRCLTERLAAFIKLRELLFIMEREDFEPQQRITRGECRWNTETDTL